MGFLKSIGIGGDDSAARIALNEVNACIDKMHDAARALERLGGDMRKFADAFRADANNLTKRRNLLRQKMGAR